MAGIPVVLIQSQAAAEFFCGLFFAALHEEEKPQSLVGFKTGLIFAEAAAALGQHTAEECFCLFQTSGVQMDLSNSKEAGGADGSALQKTCKSSAFPVK